MSNDNWRRESEQKWREHDPSEYRHNAAFRWARSAFRLDKNDVVEVCRMGGLTISKSKADGWGRNPETRRPGKGMPGSKQGERRGKPITDDEWNAFWNGLGIWLHEAERDD